MKTFCTSRSSHSRARRARGGTPQAQLEQSAGTGTTTATRPAHASSTTAGHAPPAACAPSGLAAHPSDPVLPWAGGGHPAGLPPIRPAGHDLVRRRGGSDGAASEKWMNVFLTSTSAASEKRMDVLFTSASATSATSRNEPLPLGVLWGVVEAVREEVWLAVDSRDASSLPPNVSQAARLSVGTVWLRGAMEVACVGYLRLQVYLRAVAAA
mmetsp:Transcript_70043/g.197600  ORF Transcript_70043/g.197600 Transcript_70043/m.197600 type:complete len:211 (+) Transcript_70043:507-1139(+)